MESKGHLLLQDIKRCICPIRGCQLILHSDLAGICQVQTKVFSQTVRRNAALC